MRLPTALEPVKVTPAIRGSSRRASSISAVRPVTTFSTPAGSPASCRARAKCSPESGVSVAGLKTAALPVASSGASLRAGVISGSFHGLITRMTPMGSRWVCVRVSGRTSCSRVP